jgi:hypothetical protein
MRGAQKMAHSIVITTLSFPKRPKLLETFPHLAAQNPPSKTLLPAASAAAAGDDCEAAMATPADRRIVGAEVPIPGSDRVRWIDLTVPSSSPGPANPSDPFVCVAPRPASGCHMISCGESQHYLAWYVSWPTLSPRCFLCAVRMWGRCVS